ncbi:MAG: Asp-tRNA(Asn)/Glu-tRNA(Gln) amidotransferase subunit GatC [Candidatus Nanohaloarchaea archaeon]
MVSTEKVRDVADNARINLDDEKVEKFASEFENILEVFEKLSEIDTEGVEPAFHPIDVDPETRDDEVEETLSKKEVFKNTDNEEDGHFKGPAV